jgi:hypothetical protein
MQWLDVDVKRNIRFLKDRESVNACDKEGGSLIVHILGNKEKNK